jgi:hypothetical protein
MPLSRRLVAAGIMGLLGLVFLVHRPHNSFLHDNHEHQRGLRGMRRLEDVPPEPVKVQQSESNMQLAPAEVDFVIGEARYMDHQISGMLPGGIHSGPV